MVLSWVLAQSGLLSESRPHSSLLPGLTVQAPIAAYSWRRARGSVSVSQSYLSLL